MKSDENKVEIGSILKKCWSRVESHKGINSWQLRTLSALSICRTAALGGHLDACSECGVIRVSYNSCRNRHCPKCQGALREKWIQKRNEELLPVPYFHLVFTLPSSLNSLAISNPGIVYGTLFKATWLTIKAFSEDTKHLGAKMGMISILHTWGQQLTLHPHLHCIVPGGGLSPKGNWKGARNQGKYLFPVKALSKVFRGKYVDMLKKQINDLDSKLIDDLYRNDWVVYAKQPFAHPSQVLEYLGRYTHKVAISNARILSHEDGRVRFKYKNYKNNAKENVLELEEMEFIRRFSMHILPKGFVRIRHLGILSSSFKSENIAEIRDQLESSNLKVEYKDPRNLKTYNPLLCPCCKTETMVCIEVFAKRGPPDKFLALNIIHSSKNTL